MDETNLRRMVASKLTCDELLEWTLQGDEFAIEEINTRGGLEYIKLVFVKMEHAAGNA
jgi:hypothetical protein